MQNAETIYRDAVMPLPASEQMRLAELIMERAAVGEMSSNGRASALDYLNSIRKHTAKRNAADIDEQLRKEHDSWDD